MMYDLSMRSSSAQKTKDRGGDLEEPRGSRPRLRLLLPISLISILALSTGCDIFDLDATRLVAGAVIYTPSIETDEGSSPEITTASVFFGEREPGVDVLAFPPPGIVGADVGLMIFAPGESIRDVPLEGLGDGTYVSSSVDDPSLVYQPGASYRVEVEELGDAFDVDVEQAPASEPPQGVTDDHAVGQPMTISRSQLRVAFVEVLRFEGDTVFETYSTRPLTTQEILRVIADPSPYQSSSFVIPGDAFPEAGRYAVVLTTVARGVPDFDLYSGSGVLVGAAEASMTEVY